MGDRKPQPATWWTFGLIMVFCVVMGTGFLFSLMWEPTWYKFKMLITSFIGYLLFAYLTDGVREHKEES